MADPVRLDPFQNIVNVSWQKTKNFFLLLEFGAQRSGNFPKAGTITGVNVPEISIGFDKEDPVNPLVFIENPHLETIPDHEDINFNRVVSRLPWNSLTVEGSVLFNLAGVINFGMMFQEDILEPQGEFPFVIASYFRNPPFISNGGDKLWRASTYRMTGSDLPQFGVATGPVPVGSPFEPGLGTTMRTVIGGGELIDMSEVVVYEGFPFSGKSTVSGRVDLSTGMFIGQVSEP